MTGNEMWQAFCHAAKVDENTEHEIWNFYDGDGLADELAKLVCDGVKTATASAKIAYETENEALPGTFLPQSGSARQKPGRYPRRLRRSGASACIPAPPAWSDAGAAA